MIVITYRAPHRVALVYFEDRTGGITRDEARRIAANIAKLPELLRKP